MISPLYGQLSPLRVPTRVAEPFTPTALTGLQLWLDADDADSLYDSTIGGSVVTANGDAVARWQDKSGNNNHFTQATANARPVLQTSNLNNKNGLLWDGSNDFMSGAVTGFKSFTAATIVLVCKPTTAAAADTNSAFFWGFGNAANSGGGFPGSSSLSLVASSGTLSNEKIVFLFEKSSIGGRLGSSTYARAANQAVLLASSHSSSGTVLKQNASAIALNLSLGGVTSATNTSPSLTGYTLDDVVHLGALRASGSINASPQIRFYEVLVFDKVLTAQEEQNLNAYLNDKWNLY